MQKNHFLLLKKWKNTGSAQLCESHEAPNLLHLSKNSKMADISSLPPPLPPPPPPHFFQTTRTTTSTAWTWRRTAGGGAEGEEEEGEGWTHKTSLPTSLNFGCTAKISAVEVLVVNQYPPSNVPATGKGAAVVNLADGSYRTVEPPFWADASVRIWLLIRQCRWAAKIEKSAKCNFEFWPLVV